MHLDVLVSTMDLRSPLDLLDRARVTGAAVIVNQNECTTGTDVVRESPRQVVVHSTERGLSKSRNTALARADADICLLVDDDEVLASTYEDRILSSFDADPAADIIAFAVHHRDGVRKPPLQSARLRRHELMKVSSVQIAFRRTRVQGAGVRFDEEFGAGSRFSMGEELIFLNDARRAGLRICAIPLEIAHLEHRPSSWFQGYDHQFFRSRGASFARAEPRLARLYALQWAIRKRREFGGDVRAGRAFRMMVAGINEGRTASTS